MAATLSNSRNSNKALSNRWEKFELAFKELLPMSQYIIQAEKLGSRVEYLESELRDKTNESRSQDSRQQEMFQAFEERYRAWDQERTKLEHAFDNLRQKNDQAKSEELRQLRYKVNCLGSKLETQEKKISETSALLTGTKEQLIDSRDSLRRIKTDIGVEDLSADFQEELRELSNTLRHVSRKYFFIDFSEETNTDSIFAELKRSQFMNALPQPIPISNSISSKHLRMVAAQAIIAARLSKIIFQHLYLSRWADSNIVNEALQRLSSDQPRKEAILSILLRTAYAVEEDHLELQAIDSVLSEVCCLLDPLLLLQPEKEGFRKELKTLLKRAAGVWSRARRSPVKIKAIGEGDDVDWDCCEEYDNLVELTPEQSVRVPEPRPIMILFPRICSHALAEPLHRGYALWTDQSLVIAGRSEVQEQAMRVGDRGRPDGDNGRRRQSIHLPSGSTGSHRRTASSASSQTSPTTVSRTPRIARLERERNV